nr:glutathione S-transferase family protein [Polymorphobacter sp.]
MKPILYQYQISPFCDKVRRAMHLKGLAWDTVEVPIIPGKYKAISPTGKFPAVDFGGTIVVDSTDIIAHLDTIVAEPRLIPADSRQRADALILEDWADESLYFYDLTMRNWPQNRAWFINDLLHAETGLKRRIMAAMIPGPLKKVANTQGLGRKSEAQVTAELARHYDGLAAKLTGNDWLVGDQISIADLAVRSMVFVLDRTVEGKALTTARPALAAWSQRVDAATT